MINPSEKVTSSAFSNRIIFIYSYRPWSGAFLARRPLAVSKLALKKNYDFCTKSVGTAAS